MGRGLLWRPTRINHRFLGFLSNANLLIAGCPRLAQIQRGHAEAA